MPDKLSVAFMVCPHRTKLDNPSSILAFDNTGIGSIILVDVEGSYFAFPRLTEDHVCVAMFNHKNRKLDFNTANTNTDIVATSNGVGFFQHSICLFIVSVNAPVDLSIDREFKSFIYTSRHHEYF